MITQTLSVLRGLVQVCDKYTAAARGDKKLARGELIDVNTLMARVGGAGDAVNLVELVAYLKESKLARKISGYSESLEAEQAVKLASKQSRPNSARHASIASFRAVEGLLLSLTDARDDGRVILELGDRGVVLKYVLLNPSERFADVVSTARAVVLAGGTMEPVTDFFRQLFPSIPRDRFSTLSCAHVIPKANLLTQVVSRGPRKRELEFTYASRGDREIVGPQEILTPARRARIRHPIHRRPRPRRSRRLRPLVFLSRQPQGGLEGVWAAGQTRPAEEGGESCSF